MYRFGRRVISVLVILLIPLLCAAAPPTPAPVPAELAQKAAHGAAQILFQDDFEKPGSTIDTTKWRVCKTKDTDVIEVRHGGWPNTGGFAVITDSGDQGGSYHGHA